MNSAGPATESNVCRRQANWDKEILWHTCWCCSAAPTSGLYSAASHWLACKGEKERWGTLISDTVCEFMHEFAPFWHYLSLANNHVSVITDYTNVGPPSSNWSVKVDLLYLMEAVPVRSRQQTGNILWNLVLGTAFVFRKDSWLQVQLAPGTVETHCAVSLYCN